MNKKLQSSQKYNKIRTSYNIINIIYFNLKNISKKHIHFVYFDYALHIQTIYLVHYAFVED